MLKKLRKHKKTTAEQALPDPAATANLGESATTLVGSGGRRRLPKKRRLILLIVAVVLLVGAGGWYGSRYITQKNTDKQRDKDYQTLITNVKDLRDQAEDTKARLQLEAFDKKYPAQTQEQRYRVASELAEIFKSQGDYKGALHWQQQAFDNNPNPGYSDYFALGEAYTMNRNNAEAIKYLQLALDRLKTDQQEGPEGPRSTFIQHQINLLNGVQGTEEP